MITYKQNNPQSYKRLREIYQLLDVASLDYGIVNFRPTLAAAGLLYLMVQKAFQDTDCALLNYWCSETETDHSITIHNILESFFTEILDISSIDLVLRSFHYFMSFAKGIRFTYEDPSICQYVPLQDLQVTDI